MTKQQIRWASEHDWFILPLVGGVMVRDYIDNDANKPTSIKFTCFEELYAWAGY